MDEPYILSTNALRAEAKHEVEQIFSKLMNKSVVGKPMASVNHRIDLRLTTDSKWLLHNFQC
jgi:hypothetical protein